MVRRHEIQVLRRAGHSLVETAKQVGVSQSSVQRVEAEAEVASFDTDEERRRAVAPAEAPTLPRRRAQKPARSLRHRRLQRTLAGEPGVVRPPDWLPFADETDPGP